VAGAPPVPPPPGGDERSVGQLVTDVSAQTSGLIREEIELAKAEITEKVTQLLRGGVSGIIAGVFAFLALILIMEGIAWLLNEEVFHNSYLGFFVEAVVFLLIAALGGFLAYRFFEKGAPPTPDLAIEEAKLTRETLEGGSTPEPSPPSVSSPNPPYTGGQA
jgi:uncharacterized membrane protein YqjE